MKRIIIICEGQTEQSFSNDVLQPYFNQHNIFIQAPTIRKTGGGIVNWPTLKYQIEKHLLEDKTAIVTTLIDYYGLHEHHNYPNWKEAKRMTDKNDCMNILEEGMVNDMSDNLQTRFKPYIQLHEFEGLLFSDITVFDCNFEKQEFLDYEYLQETIRENPNPEQINNGSETAPSKRLERQISDYNKIVHGSLLAQDIGLSKIREKYPRFNNWITLLENSHG